jgi:hypothetical protein
MIEYQQALDQQLALLEMHPLVKKQLCRIPGVITVGIGIREKGHTLLDELVYRVYVKEKRPRRDISRAERIPPYINGFKTDVIELPETRAGSLLLDQTLRPVEGGALITASESANGSIYNQKGTMGCLVTFGGKTVGLTNNHVLYRNLLSDPTGVIVKQADDCTCCCCVCKDRTVGKSIKGTKDNITFNGGEVYIDCAIFDISSLSASDLSASIREMDKIGPFSISRKISGTAQAVAGTQVRKMGAATGLTIGKIKEIAFDAPDTGMLNVPTKLHNTVLVEPASSYKDPASATTVPYKGYSKMVNNVNTPMFADHGDSGSVILDDNNMVVALLHSIQLVSDPSGFVPTGLVYSCPIDAVMDNLSITINKTPASGPAFLSGAEREKISISKNIIALRQREEETASLLARLESRLRESAYGKQLMDMFEALYKEVVYLVNYSRPVMVAWQRKLGPAFVDQMYERFKNNDTRIVKEVDQVRLQELLLSMSVVLEDNGSAELRTAIRKHALNLLNYAETCATLDDLMLKINYEQNNG